jgi:hypothetical protein
MLRRHLSFEINRFQMTAALWGTSTYGGYADAMIRESCLIHLRLLLDFFYPRADPMNSKYEDIFASDYLPSPGQRPQSLQDLLKEPVWLEEYRDQLDWRLAHLTLKRLQFEQNSPWTPKPQFAHMDRLIKEFLSALPDPMRLLYNPTWQG